MAVAEAEVMVTVKMTAAAVTAVAMVAAEAAHRHVALGRRFGSKRPATMMEVMVAAVMTAAMAAPDRQIENNEPVVMAATMMAVASLPTIQMRRVVAMAEVEAVVTATMVSVLDLN